jgi:selenide,water dikinase
MEDPRLLVSGSTMDDAGVYQLTDELALVQTVDFFTPMVDDPYLFGQIAAANALSDVYAMGGKPLTAMNIVAFPVNTMDVSILGDILKGGAQKIREAETLLVGGHTVEDDEPKYGLSVTGIVHPGKVLTNRGGKPGDKLILTKPLGVGIITTAMKGDMADPASIEAATQSMATLNKEAAAAVIEVGVNACTDVTGFGLLGHLYEMMTPEIGFEIQMGQVPLLPGAKDYASMGLVPGGARRNLKYLGAVIEHEANVTDIDLDLLGDPQTSGGLLVAVAPEKEKQLLEALHQKGVISARTIGVITGTHPGKVMVKG